MVESKEQEMKLLVTVLYEMRKKYEEVMEQMKLQQQQAKGSERFLSGLGLSTSSNIH
jgi:hypothetical protein